MTDGIDALEKMVEKLAAENARLRKAAMNAQVLADERRAEIERLNASRVALCNACKDCPDLARVTTERDALRATARALLAEMGAAPDNPEHCDGCAAETALRAAVSACAPPAQSSEEG